MLIPFASLPEADKALIWEEAGPALRSGAIADWEVSASQYILEDGVLHHYCDCQLH